MKILMINQHIKRIGGTETYLHTFLHERSCQSLDMMVGYTNEEMERTELPVPVVQLSPNKMAEALDRIKGFKPDVIHFNNFPEKNVYNQLRKIAPSVVFLHSHYPVACPGDSKFMLSENKPCNRRVGAFCTIAPWIQRCGTRNLFQQYKNVTKANHYLNHIEDFAKIIVASKYMKNELLLNQVSDAMIQIAALGIPKYQNLKPESATLSKSDMHGVRTDESDEIPIFLFIGRLVAAKGASIFLESLKRVRRPIAAVIIGDGRERESLEKMTASLPDYHRIKFMGWCDEQQISAWLNIARGLVVPSLWEEPFGLVGLEAMRAAKPVIGFNRGGMNEWLKHGDTGLIAAPTSKGLAKAVDRLAKEPDTALRFGQAGQASFLSDFQMQHHIERMCDIYNEVLKR